MTLPTGMSNPQQAEYIRKVKTCMRGTRNEPVMGMCCDVNQFESTNNFVKILLLRYLYKNFDRYKWRIRSSGEPYLQSAAI